MLLLHAGGNQTVVFKETFNDVGETKPDVLLQNIPNPFSNRTAVHFNTNNIVSVEIKIYDHIGKEIRKMNLKNVNEGLNIVEINMHDVPSGIYYYSLFINGKQADSKKWLL